MKYTLIYLSFLIAASLSAQQDSTVLLKEVKISDSRAGTSATDGMRTLQVITSDDISKMPVTTVSAVLEYVSNVDARNRGALGVQTDISTRGGSFEQTMILLNGAPLTDPQTGHHAMNIPVSLEQIERIEILSGGASRIFGPKAFSGAINIITKTDAENGATVSASGGEYGLYKLDAATNVKVAKQQVSVNGSYMANDGYIPNTDAVVYNFGATINGKIGQVNYSLGSGFLEKRFGAQNFYSATYPDQYEKIHTTFTQGRASWSHKNLTVKGGAYYRVHNDEFQLYREGPGWYSRSNGYFIMGEDTAPSWYTGHNYHQTHVLGGDVSLFYNVKKHTISIGVAYRDEQIRSNILGEPMSSPVHVKGEPDYALYKREADRNELNIFMEDQFESGRWFMAGGLLISTTSGYDTRLYPGLDVSWKLNERVRFYANGNMAVRYPTYTDLYYSLGGAVGSKDLKPEESISYEAGTRITSNHWTGQAAIFRREGKNLIDWIRYNGSAVTQAANITEADFSGVDANINLNAKSAFGESFIFSSIGLNYTWVTSDTSSSGFESNYVLDYLSHKLSLKLMQQLGKGFSVAWGLNLQKRNGGYLEPGKTDETSYRTFYTADVRLMHSASSCRIFLDVTNMFNREYVDFGNIAQPGRWISAGVGFHLGKGSF